MKRASSLEHTASLMLHLLRAFNVPWGSKLKGWLDEENKPVSVRILFACGLHYRKALDLSFIVKISNISSIHSFPIYFIYTILLYIYYQIAPFIFTQCTPRYTYIHTYWGIAIILVAYCNVNFLSNRLVMLTASSYSKAQALGPYRAIKVKVKVGMRRKSFQNVWGGGMAHRKIPMTQGVEWRAKEKWGKGSVDLGCL